MPWVLELRSGDWTLPKLLGQPCLTLPRIYFLLFFASVLRRVIDCLVAELKKAKIFSFFCYFIEVFFFPSKILSCYNAKASTFFSIFQNLLTPQVKAWWGTIHYWSILLLQGLDPKLDAHLGT